MHIIYPCVSNSAMNKDIRKALLNAFPMNIIMFFDNHNHTENVTYHLPCSVSPSGSQNIVSCTLHNILTVHVLEKAKVYDGHMFLCHSLVEKSKRLFQRAKAMLSKSNEFQRTIKERMEKFILTTKKILKMLRDKVLCSSEKKRNVGLHHWYRWHISRQVHVAC